MGRTYEAWNNERLDETLLNRGGTLKRLGEVSGIRYKVKVECTVCSHVWEATPQTLAQSDCPECVKKARIGRRRKAKYSLKEVKQMVEDSGYKLLSTEYVNNKQPIEFLDEEHGTTITTSFRNFLLTYKRKGGFNK